MKYKIVKIVPAHIYDGHTIGKPILEGGEIELEPLDCPASECESEEGEERRYYCSNKYCEICNPKKSLVSIDSVLKVFDEATDEYLETSQSRTYRSFIRKSIEQMKRS